MSKYFRLSAILALAGALMVGAVSSALWELLLKPFLTWISTLFLTIATLGINSLRDDLYVDIAKGLFDRSGPALLAFIVGGAIAFFLLAAAATPLFLSSYVRSRMRKHNLLKARNTNDIKQSLVRPSRLFRQLRWGVVALVAISLFEVALLTIVLARQIYVLNATVYLDQSQRIVAPYITEDQRLVIRSRAAQIRTKADFDSLNSDLLRISQSNNVPLPNFVPF